MSLFAPLLLLPQALAFVGPLRRGPFLTPRPMAVIYPPEGEDSSWLAPDSSGLDVGGSTWMDDDDWAPRLLTEEQLHIAGELTDVNHLGALARLAAAFAPPGHALHLQNMDSLSIIGVDETHIDIQVVVCGQEGCVTVKVPVIFPEACQNLHDEECILHQFEELDHQADVMLQLQESAEKTKELERQWQAQHPEDKLSYPPWWEFSIALTEECDNIKRLLNDDEFQPEMKALATKGLCEEYMDWDMERAVVSQVGPAGLYLRSKMVNHAVNAEVTAVMVDIPIPFGAVVDNVADLRAIVLGRVASAAEEDCDEDEEAMEDVVENVDLKQEEEVAASTEYLLVGDDGRMYQYVIGADGKMKKSFKL